MDQEKIFKVAPSGLDYALKALAILNKTQGIPDYSIAATYNRVFKAYIELEEYNAAIELAFKHFEEVKNTENVPDVKDYSKFYCSASLSVGHQVDGLPGARYTEAAWDCNGK